MDELKLTLEELRATLYSIGDAVITTDRDGRIRRMNPVAEQLTGWTESGAVGRSLEEVFVIINEDTLESVENPVVRVLRDNIVVGLANHTLLIAKDGTRRPIADSGAPIHDTCGDISGVVLVFRDQTEQREAERALCESEERFRSVFEHSPFGMHFYELMPDGRLIFRRANPAAAAILNFDHTPVIGLPIEEAFPPLIHTEVPARYRACVTEKTPWRTEQITYDDGRITGCYRVIAFSTTNSHMVALFEDVTPIKLAEQELMEREKRYRAIFEAQYQFTGLLTTDGIMTECNTTALKFAGVTLKDVVGRPFWEAPWWAGDEGRQMRVRNAIARAVAGEFVRYEVEVSGCGDSRALIDFTIKPVCDVNGQVILLVPEGHDITALRQAEAEREKMQAQLLHSQKMEAIGRLAGGVAHDFNNMLSVINGYSELLLSRLPMDNPMVPELQEIRNAGGRSADLVRQLLAFARRQPVEPMVLDLNPAITELNKMMRRLIGESIRLEWKPADAICLVRIDPTQLDQILANLLVNARDALTGRADGLIRVCTRVLPAGPGLDARSMVELEVTDNGCGMSPEVLAHVFEPFFTRKPKGQGTGLGLATVYGIVEQNHGTISVRSEAGQGTTFIIRFPMQDRLDGTARRVLNPPLHVAGPRTVLLVEDEKAVLKIETKMLQRLGFEVLATSEPENALQIAQSHEGEIHILVTDVIMPRMSGLVLAERIRETRPAIRVLYMSGYAEDVLDSMDPAATGDAFIQKPFTVDGLSRRLATLIDT